MTKVTFYASAYTTEKTFAICPKYGDYTDRNWYYQHSNYRSVVREACRGLSKHRSKSVCFSLKTSVDAQYEAEVLPVFNKNNQELVFESLEDELMDVIEHQSVTISMQSDKIEELRAALIAERAEKAELKQSMSAKLTFEKMRRKETETSLEHSKELQAKAENKVSVYQNIKVAQAAYMQVVHKIVQKIK